MQAEIILIYLQAYSYIALYLISIVEGPIVTVLASFLASFQYLNVWIVFLIALLGDLTGDMIYYSAGYFGKTNIIAKLIRIFKIPENKVLGVEDFYKKHGGKSIFFSKFVQGMSILVLVGAGASKMKFSKFTFYSISSSIIKTAILVILGYYFGEFYSLIERYMGITGKVIFIIAIIVIATIFFIKYFRKLKNNSKKKS